MIKLAKKLYLFKLFVFIYLGFLFIFNKHSVMAMEKQNVIDDKISINMRKKLFEILIQQKQLEEKIQYFRINANLNIKEILELEQNNIKLKAKISEIKKNISKKSKKVTFNLKPSIKIIE
ncbi:SVM family protein ['Bituminaria bituminosa' little leaf phytoplasma]|uniref:SVM family protein n=2 Tax=Candidatus Phytoplasma fabacearum TaxID=2982628 RepID=A0ABU8ZSQ8_9MOLU